MNGKLLKLCIFLLLINFPTLSVASTVYFAEIDPLQSSGYLDFDETNTFQISGTIKITTDSGSIQFENIDIESTPSYDMNDMILTDAGTYNGSYFQYVLCDTCIGNVYEGTFDNGALYLAGLTFGQHTYNYTIISSSITSVPLPGSLLLFSSSIAGLLLLFRTKASNHKNNAAT